MAARAPVTVRASVLTICCHAASPAWIAAMGLARYERVAEDQARVQTRYVGLGVLELAHEVVRQARAGGGLSHHGEIGQDGVQLVDGALRVNQPADDRIDLVRPERSEQRGDRAECVG